MNVFVDPVFRSESSDVWVYYSVISTTSRITYEILCQRGKMTFPFKVLSVIRFVVVLPLQCKTDLKKGGVLDK